MSLNEAMERWEKMKPRERDFTIADRMFGWAVGWQFAPHYSTSPSDDYKVLEKVRETWGPLEQGKFAETLFFVLDSRTPGFNHLLQYTPGTYAMVAFLVLESQREVKV